MRKIAGPIAIAAAGLIAAAACSRKAEKTEKAEKAEKAEAPKPAEPDPTPMTTGPEDAGALPEATVSAGTAPPGSLPRSPTPSTREPEKVPDVNVPLRPMDSRILALARGNADAKAVARAFPKTPRVELKARGGDKVVEVEVDLDGDERVDERWRVEPSGAAVRRARVREDSREDVFNLEGERWKLVSGSGKSATQPLPQPMAMRPIDKEILARAGKAGKPSDDVTPGKPYRVALSAEQGSAKLNRVKVDLDRDGKWDETWWVELPIVRRSAAPKDDGDYSERYRLVDEKWIRQ